MTSTSVGWVLLDGRGPDATTLDDDAFDLQTGAEATEGYTSPHAAAARGAQAIATASGHNVGAVQVTWTDEVESDATALLKSLADLGFDNIHAVPLNSAARAWGIDVGRANEHTKVGVCILKPDSATLMVVAIGAGSVRTALADTRDCAADLIEWLRTVFRKDGWLPESLHLVGSRKDLDVVAEPIRDALPIPVLDTVDAQLALARGAALATIGEVEGGSAKGPEAPPEPPWRVSYAKRSATTAAAETAVDASVNQVEAGGSSQSVQTPRNDPPRRERPRLVVHAKKLTISAAGVAVVGGALSLAAGSGLNVGQVSMQGADPASGASVTSASVHAVPAPFSALPAQRAQPLVAAPPPAPPVPPEPLAVPAEPLAVVEPAPVYVPVPQHTVAAAPPANVPVATPVAPPPVAPVAPPPVAPLTAPAPVAPPPAAPLAPPPAAPLAAPAPILPPPAGAPAPLEPADPPPPPDPIQVVLSPLFSGLP
jgi:hypothetical protein